MFIQELTESAIPSESIMVAVNYACIVANTRMSPRTGSISISINFRHFAKFHPLKFPVAWSLA